MHALMAWRAGPPTATMVGLAEIAPWFQGVSAMVEIVAIPPSARLTRLKEEGGAK